MTCPSISRNGSCLGEVLTARANRASIVCLVSCAVTLRFDLAFQIGGLRAAMPFSTAIRGIACESIRPRLYPILRGWRGQAPRQPGQIRKEAAITSPAWVVVSLSPQQSPEKNCGSCARLIFKRARVNEVMAQNTPPSDQTRPHTECNPATGFAHQSCHIPRYYRHHSRARTSANAALKCHE